MMVDTLHGKTSVLCTRDDLVRLVVGMQWREAILCFCLAAEDGYVDDSGGVVGCGADPTEETHPPASDIVDEWLGVR